MTLSRRPWLQRYFNYTGIIHQSGCVYSNGTGMGQQRKGVKRVIPSAEEHQIIMIIISQVAPTPGIGFPHKMPWWTVWTYPAVNFYRLIKLNQSRMSQYSFVFMEIVVTLAPWNTSTRLARSVTSKIHQHHSIFSLYEFQEIISELRHLSSCGESNVVTCNIHKGLFMASIP